MNFVAKVEVTLKSGLSDPEGQASAAALKRLGYEVDKVQVGKTYFISLRSESLGEVRKQLDEMCTRLLANPIKDDYKIEVDNLK